MRLPALRLPLLALILSMCLACATFGQEIASGIFHLKPRRPIAELRSEALRASPPQEAGEFRRPELVELIEIDPTIRLDIRYATSDNFLSTPLYSQARAFMQRPAAEALARVNQKLHAIGYGLLIHDAYRPWYVTKMFWEATPEDKKVFVANPAVGSKHNRGCAVDLSMYELSNGKEVAMPSVYDEMTPRAFAEYPGGTTEERHHRATLRQAMESQGFQIYPQEWWHFDYRDWKEYPIMNVRFEELGNSSRSALQRVHTARSQ